MKIIICDDQDIVRDGLELLLKLEADIKIVGIATDGSEAVEMTVREKPDLVLMDLKMPVMNGVDAIREIKAKCPDTKILVLTTYSTDEWVFDAIRAGASGYLLKDTPREGVLSAIRGTVEGKTYIDPSIAGKIMSEISSTKKKSSALITGKLTERESEILNLLAKGLGNEDIARQLFLSEGTVRNHISSIVDKLGVSDRTQAAILAIQHGLGSH
ncbi:MAG: response regulator transcription factor [Chloroflexi bacterium]|nr:response regulator transcription factor [Chloroflexota bacterium]